MQKITPFLWFDSEAEQAAEYYVSLFPNSSITSVSRYPEGGPRPAGEAFGVEFVLDGTEFRALNAGPGHPFTDAISLFISVETQEEVDRLWDALIADGGAPSRCGWLTDRWGLSWQITPRALIAAINDPDRTAAKRAFDAMMTMGKIDIAAIEAARRGISPTPAL